MTAAGRVERGQTDLRWRALAGDDGGEARRGQIDGAGRRQEAARGR